MIPVISFFKNIEAQKWLGIFNVKQCVDIAFNLLVLIDDSSYLIPKNVFFYRKIIRKMFSVFKNKIFFFT